MQIHKWVGNKLEGEYLAIDTETTNIQPGEIPELVIMQVSSDGENSYIVERDDVGDFLNLHRHSHWVGHNWAFDHFVICRHLGITMWGKVDRGEIWGTDIIFRLLGLAKYGKVSHLWNMAHCAKQILGIEVGKDDAVRINWKITDNFDNMGEDRKFYAATDACITFKLFKAMFDELKSYPNYLSHHVQMKGSLMLHDIMVRGMAFDLPKKESLLTTLHQEVTELKKQLILEGYVPKEKGNTKILQDKLHALEMQYDLKLPRTATANKPDKKGKVAGDKISTASDDLEPLYDYDGFLKKYIDFKKTEKLINFFNEMNSNRLYPRYNLLLETGRTSSYKHNHQNLPRKPGVRECFIPADGHCILAVDFGALEICTFAEICYQKFGYSKFKELLNEGKDVHKYCASMIYNIPEEKVDKSQRQLAKILSFGFFGGMCAETFVNYAKAGYNLTVTQEEAEVLKSKWHEAFPETIEYLKDPLEDKWDWDSSPFNNREMAKAIFKRIIRGATESKAGNPYNQNVISWVYNHVLPKVNPYYADKAVFGEDCYKALLTTETSLTGRVCRNRGYCQGKNYHFQSLAADIAKLAGYNLLKKSYKLVGFIHDEFLIEIPLTEDLKQVEHDVIQEMLNAAKELSPNVKYSVEGTYMQLWSKNAKTIINEDGSYTPWSIS